MHVAVTGASSGIGEAIVRKFAAEGADITLVARRTELLNTIASELPEKSHVATADLSDLERCTDWLRPAIDVLGPIDVLVNNAGIQIVEPFEEADADRHDKVLRVNLNAPLRIARTVVNQMMEGSQQGSIVNIASLAALAPTPFMSSYNASKAGLAAASESLRGELRETGINVVTVYPGPVKTAMADAAVEAYESTGDGSASALPIGDTETLAKLVHKAVRKRKRRVIYPRVYGVVNWFPSITRWMMDRYTPSLRDGE